MSVAQRPGRSLGSGPALAMVLLLGVGMTVAVGVYASVHEPTGRALFTLGFSGLLQMKSWLATAVLPFLGLQLFTALWMWRRIPRLGRPKPWVFPLHKGSGAAAFVLSLPVAFHCVWSLGFANYSSRVLLHGILGCVFYGAYAAKILGLHLPGVPRRAMPVLGGLLLGSYVAIWLTSSLWFFARSGQPLT